MSRRIHVGVDATTWWNDRGFGRFTREMLRSLIPRETGFRYTLVIDRPPDQSLPEGAELLLAESTRPLTAAAVGSGARSPRDLWKLSRRVAAARFDFFFFPAVYSYFPLLSRVPCIVAFHDTIAERYPDLVFPTRRNRWLWAAKVAIARRQAQRVMTVSQASAKDLEELLGVPRSRIDVVSEAADPRFRCNRDPEAARALRARHEIPERVPLLVYVGGLNPHKNILGLLGALERVLRRFPDVHLAIVGDTSGKGFYDNVAELTGRVDRSEALSRRVRFTGYISDDDLVTLYSCATALVLPSFWEGFGLPAVEAMSCGLPVLASCRGSLPEVVGDAGAFFDPESIDDMVAVIEDLIANPDRWEAASLRAVARAQEFTWERGADLAEESFRRLLDSKRGRS